MFRQIIFSTIKWLVLCVSLAKAEPAALSSDDLAQTYGFYLAQRASIQKIADRFPDLGASAAKAELQFDRQFQSAIHIIEGELKSRLGPQWNDVSDQLNKKISTTTESAKIARSEAVSFIQKVELRAKGDLSSPVLETLLICTPELIANPAGEFERGLTNVYRSKDHQKAKGVDLQIRYPKSWKPKEGDRPNVVQVITSANGRGSELIIVLVKDLPLPGNYKFSEKDLDEIFSADGLAGMVPKGSTVVATKRITLDGQPAGMITFDQLSERVDKKVASRIVEYITIYNNKMIFLQGMVASLAQDQKELKKRFDKMEPLFKLVANSFVLQDQYR